MTQINHDVVRSAIRELIDSKTISGAALARETGTSTATVSQFLNHSGQRCRRVRKPSGR